MATARPLTPIPNPAPRIPAPRAAQAVPPGSGDPPAAREAPRPPTERGLFRSAIRMAPGLGLVLLIALVASRLGALVPVIGGPVFGIVLGMLVALVRRPGAAARPGMAWAAKQGLQLAIVLLGTGLSLAEIVRTGAGSLPVMTGTLAAALLAAWGFGRLLGVGYDLRALIGVGTAICGASAIAATSGVVGADEMDIAYSISTIFLFNVVAVLLYPTLGHVMHLTQHAFGLWAGTAVNDTSSVVAAAYTFGRAAGNYAVVVKLTRTTMIIPVTLALAGIRVLQQRRAARADDPARGASEAAPRVHWGRLIPWFIVWFLLASVANTLGLFPAAWQHALAHAALFMIVMALAGIGLSAEFAQMARTGVRPLVLGLLLWATVGLSSLALQHLTGQF